MGFEKAVNFAESVLEIEYRNIWMFLKLAASCNLPLTFIKIWTTKKSAMFESAKYFVVLTDAIFAMGRRETSYGNKGRVPKIGVDVLEFWQLGTAELPHYRFSAEVKWQLLHIFLVGNYETNFYFEDSFILLPLVCA